MIVIRKIKLFSWDIEPDYGPFTLSESDIKSGKSLRVFEETVQFKKQFASSTYKKEIKALKDKLRKGFIFKEDEVHTLTGLSKQGSLFMSKRISQTDRLNYRVYRPVDLVVYDQDGNPKIVKVQKIVLDSCKGHRASGQGDYLKDRKLKEKVDKKRNRNNKKY